MRRLLIRMSHVICVTCKCHGTCAFPSVALRISWTVQDAMPSDLAVNQASTPDGPLQLYVVLILQRTSGYTKHDISHIHCRYQQCSLGLQISCCTSANMDQLFPHHIMLHALRPPKSWCQQCMTTLHQHCCLADNAGLLQQMPTALT